MKNLENIFYAGIGIALKGKERVAELAKKFAKESKMDAKDGKVFVQKAVQHAEAAQKELSKKIDDAVKTAAGKMGYVTKKEADQLKAEIIKIKAQLNKKPKAAAKTTKAKTAKTKKAKK